jgi:DNA-binding beta-propeller fold protein YncE
MPVAFVPRSMRSLCPMKSTQPNIALVLLAFAMFAAGCGNRETSPAWPTLSGASAHVAPIDFSDPTGGGSYLYIAFDGNSENAQIDVLRRKNLAKGIVEKIRTGIEYPAGIFVDPSETLYVANELDSGGHDTVTAYKAGAENPFRTYQGIGCAADVLVGADGLVYIADLCGADTPTATRPRGDSCVDNGEVHVYAAGSTKQIRLLHFKGAPVSLTLDSKNDLYVGYENACGFKGQVRRYEPGAVKGVDLLPPKTIFSIGGIALDNYGKLLVADELHGAIDVFSAEHEPPSRIISTGQTFCNRLAFDRQENRLYVTFPYTPDLRRHVGLELDAQRGPKRPNTLVVIDYSSGKLLYTLRKLVPGWVPSGVAAFPPPPFGPPF